MVIYGYINDNGTSICKKWIIIIILRIWTTATEKLMKDEYWIWIFIFEMNRFFSKFQEKCNDLQIIFSPWTQNWSKWIFCNQIITANQYFDIRWCLRGQELTKLLNLNQMNHFLRLFCCKLVVTIIKSNLNETFYPCINWYCFCAILRWPWKWLSMKFYWIFILFVFIISNL